MTIYYNATDRKALVKAISEFTGAKAVYMKAPTYAYQIDYFTVTREGNHNIKVGFAEPRSGGGSNAKLANILEYGKHGQPAKPFLKPAKSASNVESEADPKNAAVE